MNTGHRFQTISWKFLVILVPAMTAVALITEAAYTYTKIAASKENLANKIETISEVHSLAVANPLWTLDLNGLNRSLQTISLHPEIVCVDVSELDTTERYQWPAGCRVSNSHQNIFTSDLFFGNEIVGKMDLYYTNLMQREQLRHDLLTTALFFLLQISVAGVVAYLALRYIVGRPVNQLIASIKKAEHSNELQTVNWSSQDELGRVTSAYNKLVSQIEDNTRELVAARQQAETAAYTKSRFLANMSHELRTPLNAVIGITEMLREEAQEQRSDTEPYDRVAMSGRHLLKLIDDVLDFSKIEAGAVSILIEDIDLGVLLEEACVTVQPMAQKRNNQLTLEFGGRPELIESDSFRLRQILINLLSNACKFTKDGKITLAVTEHNIDGNKAVRFCVKDTGIGISQEQSERLFTDFFQADISTTRQYGGTGLGLAISQRLCRLLGGEISLQSTVGEGSEFSFTLLTEPTEIDNTDNPPIREGDFVTDSQK